MLDEVSSSESYQPLHSLRQRPQSKSSSPTTPNPSNPLSDKGARRPTFFGDIAKSALSTSSTTQAGKLNILGALLSHDNGDSDTDSSTRSSSPIPVRLRKDNASVTRRRRKTDAPLPIPISSSPPTSTTPSTSPTTSSNNESFGSNILNFAESAEETKRLVASLQKTEDISIHLDDTASTVNVNNTIYVKMDYAKTQVEEIMNKFSNAKQEFKEKTKKLQKHFEKQDNEKMAKIQSFMEEFNEKYTSMQKRYQETLSKKYKEKIDDLGGKVKTYASEKDELRDRLVSETTKYYEDMRVHISSFEKIIAGIEKKEKERADKIISQEKIECNKQIEGAYERLTRSINVQKKLFFGLVNYMRKKEKECTQLGNDLVMSRTNAARLKENCEKQEICIKESENREKDYQVIVNNQKDKIIDLGKRLDFYITKTFSDSNVNTDLTSQTMDKIEKDLNFEIEKRTKENEKLKKHAKNQAETINGLEKKGENLESNLQSLTSVISALQQENATLKKNLEKEQEVNFSLQEIKRQLDVKVNEMTRKENLTKDILKNQKQKISTLESQLLSSTPSQEVNVVMDGLRKEVQIERDEKQRLQSLMIEKESIISSLEAKFSDSGIKYKDLQLKFHKMEEEFLTQANNFKEAAKSKLGSLIPTIIEKVVPPEPKITSSQNTQTEARFIESKELDTLKKNIEALEIDLKQSNLQLTQLKEKEREFLIKIKQITEEFSSREATIVAEAKEKEMSLISEHQNRESKLGSEYEEREKNLISQFNEKERDTKLKFREREELLKTKFEENEANIRNYFAERESRTESEFSQVKMLLENDKAKLTRELSSLNNLLYEKTATISSLEMQLSTSRTELQEYHKFSNEHIDFEKKEVVIRHFNSLRRELEILKAEIELRKTVEEELREEIERLKKEVGLTTGKYRNLLSQSHFRRLEDNTEIFSFEEEMDRLTVENKQLTDANKLLEVQIASFSKDVYYEESQKFQQLYLAEREKTNKLSIQCKQFVLKITELEQFIESLSANCEKAFDDIARERQRTEVALRLVKKGQKEKEEFIIEIENLKHQFGVALDVLRRNQFEQEFYRMLKKSTLIKGIL